MMEANIIVHYLLGDALATRLEQLVQYTAGQHLRHEHVGEHAKSLPGIGDAPTTLGSTDKITVPKGRIRLRLTS